MPDIQREKMSIDFGIEETINNSSKELVDNLLGGVSGNPDDVQVNPKKKSSTTGTSTTKPPVKQQKEEEGKDQEDINFSSEDVDLFGEEEKEEEESSTTTETTTIAQVVSKEEEEQNEEGEGEEEDNTLSLLGQDLLKIGIFSKDEDEKDEDFNFKDPQALLERFQYEKKKGISEVLDSFLSKFGDDRREMFDAIFVNGVEPKEYLATFTKLEDLAGLDLSIEANQKKVYKEYFLRQGFSEEKAEARVQKALINGELEEDSALFHSKLVEQDGKELANQKEAKEKQQLAQKRMDVEFANNVGKILNEKLKEKEFDGVPLSPQIAQKAYSFLNDKKYKLPSGEQLTEFDKLILELKRPENHATKVKLALLALNNFDLTKVKAKEKNEEARQSFAWAARNKSGKSIATTQKKENANFI